MCLRDRETVVKELFANPEAASSTVFAKEVDADKAKTMVEPLVADANPAIDGVDKSMSDSTVYVTAKTEQGGDVQYKVSLVRDQMCIRDRNRSDTQENSASGR